MNQKLLKIILRILFSFLLSFELCFIGEMILMLKWKHISAFIFILLILVITVIAYLIRISNRRLFITSIVLLLIFSLCICVPYGIWKSFSSGSAYEEVDFGKENLYSGHNVLILVPHQDDDFNVAEGVIEEFTKYGSIVRIAFTTNGDSSVPVETRLGEALAMSHYYNIPEENVIFLGYGDQYSLEKPLKPYIYNDYDNIVLTSTSGENKTYALDTHPAFNEGNSYTREHFHNDIQALILKYMPDIIICNDYDGHYDHGGTSLMFDEVIGDILKSTLNYRPIVLKAFAYDFAYYALDDYYAENICSTKSNKETDWIDSPNSYLWSERFRLPVNAATLSASLINSKSYNAARIYASQTLAAHSSRVINGDKVYWLRRTDSLLQGKDVSIKASSGDCEKLLDFKINECYDFYTRYDAPYNDATWVPESDDNEKTVTISFEKPKSIRAIYLYDNPSLEDNILSAEVLIGDEKINVNRFAKNGSATKVNCNFDNISEFSVKVLSYEGNSPGLTEIEAFENEDSQSGLSFLKIVNGNDDYVYDYNIDSSGVETFCIDSRECDISNLKLVSSNNRCSAEFSNGLIEVSVPKGQSTLLTVESADGKCSDTVKISNPVIHRSIGQFFEKNMRTFFPSFKMTNIYLLFA